MRDRHRAAAAVAGLAAAAFAAALAGGGAVAQSAPPAEKPRYSSFNGHQTYKSFCLNCHGMEGKGDGYLADELKTKPADLTRLAENAGGEYPAERVRASVDGTEAVKGHGMREMPVWGDVFIWPEKDSPERRAVVERKIGELVEYLRSIQQPPAKS
jgi:hypothetical protein